MTPFSMALEAQFRGCSRCDLFWLMEFCFVSYPQCLPLACSEQCLGKFLGLTFFFFLRERRDVNLRVKGLNSPTFTFLCVFPLDVLHY